MNQDNIVGWLGIAMIVGVVVFVIVGMVANG